MAHPLVTSDDHVTLGSCSHLLGFMDKSGLINEDLHLCGGIGSEAVCRVFLDKNAEPIEPDDLEEIQSHDVDFRGHEKFFSILRNNYSRAIGTEWEYFKEGAAAAMPMGYCFMRDSDQPDEKSLTRIEVLDRLYYLDVGVPPPYQGITTIEKPLGPDGPRVKLLDPLSLIKVKTHVAELLDAHFDDEMAPLDFRMHALRKGKKYRWHIRKISLTIPIYLDVVKERYLSGEIPNNPAIMARHLLEDISNRKEFYESIIGERQTGIIKGACLRHSEGVTRTLYTAEDFAPKRI